MSWFCFYGICQKWSTRSRPDGPRGSIGWTRVSVLARIGDKIENRDRRIVGNFRQKIHIVIVGSSVRFSQKNHIHDRRIVGKNLSNDRRIVGKNNQKNDRRIVGKG